MSRETVGRPMEILLIEDSFSDAGLTIEALKDGRIKHRLTLISDGEQAIRFLYRKGEFANAPRPDLILLDLQLPRKDGRAVLAELRSDEDLKYVPVVVLTASRIHEDVVRSEHLRVDAYLTKPVDAEAFISVVQELKRHWLADVILPCSPIDKEVQ